MKKTFQKNNEIREFRKLLKKYITLALKTEKIENEIYQMLKKRLQILPEEATRTAWLFIEGITITEEEKAVIESILEKKIINFKKLSNKNPLVKNHQGVFFSKGVPFCKRHALGLTPP